VYQGVRWAEWILVVMLMADAMCAAVCVFANKLQAYDTILLSVNQHVLLIESVTYDFSTQP